MIKLEALLPVFQCKLFIVSYYIS